MNGNQDTNLLLTLILIGLCIAVPVLGWICGGLWLLGVIRGVKKTAGELKECWDDVSQRWEEEARQQEVIDQREALKAAAKEKAIEDLASMGPSWNNTVSPLLKECLDWLRAGRNIDDVCAFHPNVQRTTIVTMKNDLDFLLQDASRAS